MTGEYTTRRNLSSQQYTHDTPAREDTRFATRVLNKGQTATGKTAFDRTMVFNTETAGGRKATGQGRAPDNRINAANRSARTSAPKTGSAAALKTKSNIDIKPRLEINQKKRSIAKVISITAAVVVFAFALIILVNSISDIYKTEHVIASLEKQVEALEAESGQLRIQLEEKNDIRVIEELATKKYGMVREDSLQRQFVSLSSGESIQVYESETETSGSVLLSSVFSAIERFFNGED